MVQSGAVNRGGRHRDTIFAGWRPSDRDPLNGAGSPCGEIRLLESIWAAHFDRLL